MGNGFTSDLTTVEIRALAASIYEPLERSWRANSWECPQCQQWNAKCSLQCGCGISRDGLPEFSEQAVSERIRLTESQRASVYSAAEMVTASELKDFVYCRRAWFLNPRFPGLSRCRRRSSRRN